MLARHCSNVLKLQSARPASLPPELAQNRLLKNEFWALPALLAAIKATTAAVAIIIGRMIISPVAIARGGV